MSLRIAIGLLLCAAVTAAAEDVAEPEAGQTGDYSAHFTQRSPLSNLNELTTRFRQKSLAPDYDLGKELFIVHVSEQYDAEKPPGLLVLINYKDTSNPPVPVLPLLDQKNLIFIAQQSSHEAWWVRCGVALDAVYNMQQLYKIDPTRTYIFSFTPNEDNCGLRLITSYPDVFNGALLCQEWGFWAPLTAANGGIYPAKIPHPPMKYFPLAKSHPIILASETSPAYLDLVGKALKAQGFLHSKITKNDTEDYHYPNYKVPWLTDVLTFLDTNVSPLKAPTSHPASMPAN